MNAPYNGDFYETQQYTHGKHDGLDLVGITHKEIHCVYSGVVIHAGWENENNRSQGFGQYVAIRQDNSNRVWYYGHMSEIKCKTGEHINIGDIIGIEGTTGYSTGNHLHICVRENGIKGCDLNVSQILGIPNILNNINNPYNDGYEPVNSADNLSTTDFIKIIQKYLNTHFNAGLVIDGICGTKTKSAIKKYFN